MIFMSVVMKRDNGSNISSWRVDIIIMISHVSWFCPWIMFTLGQELHKLISCWRYRRLCDLMITNGLYLSSNDEEFLFRAAILQT